ncbi:hypothetical protein GCM10020000_28480 [Streptomyces olivoverticillatus]
MNGGLMTFPTPGRLAGYLGLAVLGFLAGTAGALVQGGWFPGGLLLALLGIAGLCWGGVTLMRSRAERRGAGRRMAGFGARPGREPPGGRLPFRCRNRLICLFVGWDGRRCDLCHGGESAATGRGYGPTWQVT